MSQGIDVMHLGRDRVICAYQLDGLVIDPGPSTCVHALLEGMGDTEPRALLLTHIHLDHAGASGVLAGRFPDLQVYVHEVGAPHLIDPSKLIQSAERLYGSDMERLWGEVAPVPRERVHALSGGERVEGFRVEHTPGHAPHHVCWLHEETGDAYVGDMAGVRIPPHEYTLSPTPPPDIDLEAWSRSLQLIEDWGPGAVCLTHFGRYEDVGEQLDRVRDCLRRRAESARGSDLEAFVAELEREVDEALPADAGAAMRQAAPPDQLFLGLNRYWSKRKATTETA